MNKLVKQYMKMATVIDKNKIKASLASLAEDQQSKIQIDQDKFGTI